MTQKDINLYELEDSLATFMEAANDFAPESDPLSDLGAVTPDDILDVSVSPEPSFGNVLTNPVEEMDDETKRFVVDEFARRAAELPGDTITPAQIPDLAIVIQAENGIKGDVPGFLEELMRTTAERLANQNVSEAQPSGVVSEDAPAVDAPVADVADPMGEIPAMEPAPATPELEPNVDEPAPAFDEPAPVDGAADGLDLGAQSDVPAAEAPAAEPAADEGDDLLAGLDDFNFDDLDGDEPATEGAPETETPAEDVPADEPAVEDTPADEPATEDVPADEPKPVEECGEKPAEPIVEGDEGGDDEGGDEGGDVEAQLESMAAKFAVDTAERNARQARLESINQKYEAYRRGAAKKAALESIIGEQRKVKAAAAKLNAKLESIITDFQKNQAIVSKRTKLESASKKLDAKLESIMSSVPAKSEGKKLDAKLESIMDDYAKKAKASAEPSLDAKLESIVADVKAKLTK